MIVQLTKDCNNTQQSNIEESIAKIGYQSNEVKTSDGHYLVCIGKKQFDIRQIGHLKGIKDIHRVSDQYKLVSSKWKIGKTEIPIANDCGIGNGEFEIMIGPCSIEGEDQIELMVNHLVKNNVRIMRGGVFKPRSSPYSFRGLGIEGLKHWYKACRENNIKIVSEVMEPSQIEDMYPYVDIFQVGARNSQNFNLLDELGKIDKPVLLKRGISGTINEFLHSAEYIFSNGNEKILLCERGIRTYEGAYRNTLDLNAVVLLKEMSHLPVIVDPSHGIGIRRFVESMALSGIMAGADGLIIEVHNEPEKAISDGQQSLNFQEAEIMYDKIRRTRALYNSLELS
jgi:3-deoxy-7-phosphoheptulonate synthase